MWEQSWENWLALLIGSASWSPLELVVNVLEMNETHFLLTCIWLAAFLHLTASSTDC